VNVTRSAKKRVRVLVVDDSALVRLLLERHLSEVPELEVVGIAGNPYEARDLLVTLRPDVMTLDIEMPRMDGLSFLRRLMAVLPTPTIVLSSLVKPGSPLAAQAREAGAVDVVTKPSAGVEGGLTQMMGELVKRILAAAEIRVERRWTPLPVDPRPAAAPESPRASTALDATTDFVIAFGASTGGVAALGRILPLLPPWTPGVVIVQHMPAGFTAQFAERMDGLCAMRVSEARDGDRVLRGHVSICPGGERHLEIERCGGEYRCALVAGPPRSGHVPSVDVLFESVARSAGRNAAACLLTGMGADGARGLLALRLAGGRTLAQDEATSAVWGMPGAAVELGAAQQVVPLDQIPTLIATLQPGERSA